MLWHVIELQVSLEVCLLVTSVLLRANLFFMPTQVMMQRCPRE